MKINYDKLYYFTEDFGLSGRGFRAGPQDIGIDEDALTRGKNRPKHAIPFEHRMGKRICDVIWTTLPPIVLVSKDFCNALKGGEFIGWSTYPVRIYDKEGKQIRGYAGLSFLGRAGSVDFSRSKKVWRGPHYEGGPKWQNYVGLYFKDDNWDGADFFMAEGHNGTFVTERAKEALSGLKLSNVEFERLSEYESEVPDSLTKLRLIK